MKARSLAKDDGLVHQARGKGVIFPLDFLHFSSQMGAQKGRMAQIGPKGPYGGPDQGL